jgi:hypothetical protein
MRHFEARLSAPRRSLGVSPGSTRSGFHSHEHQMVDAIHGVR